MLTVSGQKYMRWNPLQQTLLSNTYSRSLPHMNQIFATHGLPYQIVSDNGPQFMAEKFKQFCLSHGIHHTTTAPCHPHSNGEVERLVQTFKVLIRQICKASELCGQLPSSLQSHPTFCDRSNPFRNVKQQTMLDLLHPCQLNVQKSLEHQKQSYDSHTQPRHFLIGDPVWVHNLIPGRRWLPGTVKDRRGKVMYQVVIDGQTVVHSRHATYTTCYITNK